MTGTQSGMLHRLQTVHQYLCCLHLAIHSHVSHTKQVRKVAVVLELYNTLRLTFILKNAYATASHTGQWHAV